MGWSIKVIKPLTVVLSAVLCLGGPFPTLRKLSRAFGARTQKVSWPEGPTQPKSTPQAGTFVWEKYHC